MIGRRTSYLIAALLSLGITGTTPALSATSSALQSHACTVGQTKKAALCGTLTVYENRAAQSGRTIAIHFILIKAKHPSQRAIAWNPGGPGASATEAAPYFADAPGAIQTLRDTYDILLMDNRGTGQSGNQQCELTPAAHPDVYFMQLWPDAPLKACRDRLAAHADLSLYTTSLAADDLDQLRDALGYPRLALNGGSYGTFFYLVYARQHPEHVESIVLDGVAPPHFYFIPLPMAAGAQTAIVDLASACRADASCSGHFPNFASHFWAVIHRFDGGPVTVPVRNTVTHAMQNVKLSKEVLVEAVRHALYFPGDSAYLPVIFERAFANDYKPLASLVDEMSQRFGSLGNGLNLSVTCAEDIPFITETDIVKSSAGSFEGDARVRAQMHACGIWNVRPVSKEFIEPVTSDLPILMISGSDDPATPPQYGKAALAYLKNARQMLVKGASHDSDYPPCVDKAIVSFTRARSASGLDLDHCAATYRRPPFQTLTYFESAPGENRALSARFHTVLTDMIAGRIDRSQFTASANRVLSDASVKEFSSESAGFGELQSFVYRSVTASNKGKTYRYLAHFAQGTANVTLTLDPAGKIALFDVTPD